MDDDKNLLLLQLPEKPQEPSESECCGNGCTLCVYDIYKKQLEKWEKVCQEINASEGENRNVLKIESEIKNDKILTPYEYRPLKILSIIKETKNVQIFQISMMGEMSRNRKDFPVDIKMGQHVLIKIDQSPTKPKPYTILRIIQNNFFEILIKMYENGALTQHLCKLNVGDNLRMRGPFGKKVDYEPNSYKNVIIICCGTGFSPMYRIIENILNNEDDYTKIQVLFCIKKPNDIFLLPKFKEWSSYWNFKIEYFLSQINDSHHEDMNELKKLPYRSKVHQKRIEFDDLKLLIKSIEITTSLFFICGTKSFEKDIINYLQQLNVEHFQTF